MKSRSSFRPHKYSRLLLSTPQPKAPKKLWTRPRQPPEDVGFHGGSEEEQLDLPIGPEDYQHLSPHALNPDGSRSVSHAPSFATSRPMSTTMSRASALSRPYSSALAVFETPGEIDPPLPLLPWCGRCPPLRPYASLPLRPDEVCEEECGWHAEDDELEVAASPSRKMGCSKTHDFAEHMRQTVASTGTLTICPDKSARVWGRDIQEIHLGKAPARSRFSRSMYEGPNPAPVLRRLTSFQVGLLERWAINHVKLQCIDSCSKEHHCVPLHGKKSTQSMRFATMCQLVRRYAVGKLKDEEYVFLFDKLQDTPFISGIPSHLLPSVAKKIRVFSSSREKEIFTQGELAQGVYVLVQGEVVLRNEASPLARDCLKIAPCALLTGDVLSGDGRPFCMQPDESRVWSRSAFSFKGDPSTSVTMLLFVPLSALQEVSEFFRMDEIRDRDRCITTMFAQEMLLAPRLCMRHSERFRVAYAKRSEVLLQSGSKLTPSDAQLMLIIEGEVVLVHPRKLVAKKRAAAGKSRQAEPREKKGRGEVIGQAALYGLPYLHTAIVVSETAKILSLRVADYLEKFLHRTAVLDPPPATPGPSPNGMEAGTGTSMALDTGDGPKGTVEVLMSLARKACKIDLDAKALRASEWKSLGPKHELPRHKALMGKKQQQTEDTAVVSDLCYPRDCDLFPLAQRNASSMQRGSAWCSTSIGTTSPSTMSSLDVLDSKIARAAATVDRLEAAHWLHADYGVHVVDTSSDPLPEGSLLAGPPPGSALLLSVGAIDSPRRLQA